MGVAARPCCCHGCLFGLLDYKPSSLLNKGRCMTYMRACMVFCMCMLFVQWDWLQGCTLDEPKNLDKRRCMTCMLDAGEAYILCRGWSCLRATLHVTGPVIWCSLQATCKRTASELESGPEFVREFRICGIGTAASFAKEFSELWDKATGTLAFLSALHEKTHN